MGNCSVERLTIVRKHDLSMNEKLYLVVLLNETRATASTKNFVSRALLHGDEQAGHCGRT
jgi:hypothetical protein